ncbi:helix-turn-helix binding domain protein [Bacillus phage Janet]|nr:helix-turn-helix binding domain protein [Bacillus phage Janet]
MSTATIAPNGVLIDAQVLTVNNKLVDVLQTLLQRAKNSINNVAIFKKTELAKELGKDPKTVYRHIKELEQNGIFEVHGEKGRGKGSVVKFNDQLVKFTTSDEAVVNSGVNIKELAQQKFPKKPKKENPNKRPRRTKHEMLDALLKRNKEQDSITALNEELEQIHYPTWSIFQRTDNPELNYKAYIAASLYSRYAYLFTKRQNEVYTEKEKAGLAYSIRKLTAVSPDYHVLEEQFFGTTVFKHFVKYVQFCEENSIDLPEHMASQFKLSTFIAEQKNAKKSTSAKPYVNTLYSEKSLEAYNRDKRYGKRGVLHNIRTIENIQPFSGDIVVTQLTDELSENGIKLSTAPLEKRYGAFFFPDGTNADELIMLEYYNSVVKQMQEQNISQESQDAIKDFIVRHTYMHFEGALRGVKKELLVSELLRMTLASIPRTRKQDELSYKREACYALGKFYKPHEKDNEKVIYAALKDYVALTDSMHTSFLFELIEQKNGVHISYETYQNAFKEVGKDVVPVTKYCVLDIEQIVEKLRDVVEVELLDTSVDVADVSKAKYAPKKAKRNVDEDLVAMQKSHVAANYEKRNSINNLINNFNLTGEL